MKSDWTQIGDLWAPKMIERFDLPHGTIFTVEVGIGFTRQAGQLVRLPGQVWEVVGCDDYRTAGGPHDGEMIALAVNPIALSDPTRYVLATKYSDGDPFDQWAVGFVVGRWQAGFRDVRFDIVNSEGMLFRNNGFRRVERISARRGTWLVERIPLIEELKHNSKRTLWGWRRMPMGAAT